jgi:uncharacterized protein (DUF2461 family)
MSLFNTKTFKYFDDANTHMKSKTWFEKNEALYSKEVKEPFGELLSILDARFSDELDHISISPRNLSKPRRPKNKWADKGVNKDFAGFLLAQKKTSLFEWNPGIHFQLGSSKDDNHLGMGLYMVSGRQIKKLRNALLHDFTSLELIINKQSFVECWGDIVGDKYKRLPTNLPENHRAFEYFFFKQFYITRSFTRTEVKRANFPTKVIECIEAGLPLLKWIQKSVGTY